MTKNFSIDSRKITVYQSDGAAGSVPAIYINVFMKDGSDIWDECRKLGCPDFTLVAIGGIDWDNDMTPWKSGPILPGDGKYAGNADEHLARITDRIMAEVCRILPEKPAYNGLAGYSLAGLFAAYCAYRTDRFSRFASMSGSLWYPGFAEYSAGHEFFRKPDCFYLSLGDKEEKVRSEVVSKVGDNTRGLYERLGLLGIPSIFEMNPGNHYKDASLRTAKGIKWILTH